MLSSWLSCHHSMRPWCDSDCSATKRWTCAVHLNVVIVIFSQLLTTVHESMKCTGNGASTLLLLTVDVNHFSCGHMSAMLHCQKTGYPFLVLMLNTYCWCSLQRVTVSGHLYKLQACHSSLLDLHCCSWLLCDTTASAGCHFHICWLLDIFRISSAYIWSRRA